MSATMTVPEQIDGLEKLITLASLRKEDIIATQTEVRKQLQLTQGEQGKVAEAKSWIAKYDGLAADLQRREDELSVSKIEHEDNVKNEKEHVASENIRLETFSASLNTRESQLTEASTKQASEAGRLSALGKQMETDHLAAMDACKRVEANNAVVTHANAEENERLKRWESELRAKAKNLREQAANF